MAGTEPLRVGLAGLGTVGAGVLRLLAGNGAAIAARAGRPLRVTAVSARDRARDRGSDLSGAAWEADPVALALRPDVDVLVEVIGGTGPALAAVEAALGAGKAVVTANKAMLALHGAALAARADARGAALRWEAAVAGGIPVIKALGEGLPGNRITRVMGVLNGTCNYILTTMEKTGADYADVLADAQRLGYAEADPAVDVGGIDAAHKLALLAALAFGTRVDFAGVAIRGIGEITLADIRRAADMGYRVKLLGVARMNADGLEQRMEPCLVPAGSTLGGLEGVTNAVAIEGDAVGQVTMVGPGAGAGPTASAVIGDLVDIARGNVRPAFGLPAAALARPERSSVGSEAAYYLRLTLRDRPGALAQVATVLGEHDVSIDRMRQYGHRGTEAPVVILTHPTEGRTVSAALAGIAALDVSLADPVALRIEEV
jgi:homoserine dehydrogenase